MTKNNKIRRVLIANRGEIAVRVTRTLREMGIETVAVYSEVDRIAPHVRVADIAIPIGAAPAPESYLRGDLLIDVARANRVDAIHPGYGFLSENAAFAQAVVDAGLVFIGPPAAAMRAMGSKTAAREVVSKARVPIVPGSDGPLASVDEARKIAKTLGYPVLLKAAAGGGGKGMRVVEGESELESGFRAARSEAKNAFGDETVYMEKVIVNPRHVEIQILSGPDSRTLWLGERECSMQRRHQKIIEESPSLAIDEATRVAMGEVACRAAEVVGYVGAGTCEFLVGEDKRFYFLEMNTRLQVEHPVTELCCGIDLVEAQVRIAEGEPLPWGQADITRVGHAMEARIYAEDPRNNFMPCPGKIVDLVLPHGPGVRVDCGVAAGFEVPRHYDPMIAKIAVWGQDRERARRRLSRALGETAVKGITTNTAFLRQVVELAEFKSGNYHTGTVAETLAKPPPTPPDEVVDIAIAATVINAYRRDVRSARQTAASSLPRGPGWRSSQWRAGG